MQRLVLLIIVVFCLPVPGWSAQQYTFKVTDQKPQSREHFVQGLEIIDDYLYVSTGLYGRSQLLRYHFADGALDSGHRLDARHFGEGLDQPAGRQDLPVDLAELDDALSIENPTFNWCNPTPSRPRIAVCSRSMDVSTEYVPRAARTGS